MKLLKFTQKIILAACCILSIFTIPCIGWDGARSISESVDPPKGSPASEQTTIFIQGRDITEKIFFTKYPSQKTTFFKKENITIEVKLLNLDDNRISDIIIEEKFPQCLNYIGPKFINILNKSIILNSTIQWDKNSGSVKFSNISKLNGHENITLYYIVRANGTGEYIFPPGVLEYKYADSTTKELNSPATYINVINRKPRIENIKIMPNPAKFGKNIKFEATVSDLDGDAVDCELSSSIDGSRNRTGYVSLNENNTYIFKYNTKDLSEGHHMITFKVSDLDGELAEEKLDLIIDNYYWIIPAKHVWGILIAFIGGLLLIIFENIIEFYINKKY